jgi:hypothetical protein
VIRAAAIAMSDQQRECKRYKFWRNLMILAWAGLFPVICVIGFLAARIFKVPAPF